MPEDVGDKEGEPSYTGMAAALAEALKQRRLHVADKSTLQNLRLAAYMLLYFSHSFTRDGDNYRVTIVLRCLCISKGRSH